MPELANVEISKLANVKMSKLCPTHFSCPLNVKYGNVLFLYM